MHLTDPNTKRNFARYCRDVLGITDKDAMRVEFDAFTAHCTDEIDVQTKTMLFIMYEVTDWRGYFAWNKQQIIGSE